MICGLTVVGRAEFKPAKMSNKTSITRENIVRRSRIPIPEARCHWSYHLLRHGYQCSVGRVFGARFSHDSIAFPTTLSPFSLLTTDDSMSPRLYYQISILCITQNDNCIVISIIFLNTAT